MTETAPGAGPRVFEVGPDRVTFGATEAVIEAKHALPDWDVREINHVPVYVQDRKFYLVAKTKAEAPYAVRYLLKPWPEYQATNANGFLTYDADVVGARDAQLRAGQVDDVGHAFLMPIYPVLGLLWSGAQKRLVRFGFVPHAITGFSIFVTFSLVFGQTVFALILLNSSFRVGQVIVGGFLRAMANSDHLVWGPFALSVTLLDILLLVMLIVDTLVRYSLYMRDDQWAGGFFEWIVPHRKPKAATAPRGVAPQT
ncbi:MAG TPA: hypothetical protein VJA21_06270 [Verrucomicrobiae bacterium]